MTSLVAVIYLCVRVLPAVPCGPCADDCWEKCADDDKAEFTVSFCTRDAPECRGCGLTNWPCHDETIVEHELRSRLEAPLSVDACSFSGCACITYPEGGSPPCECRDKIEKCLREHTRQPYRDGDWTCEPIKEIQP